MVKFNPAMIWDKEKEEELAGLLNRFASFIRAHIQKFNLQKYGLDPDDIAQEVRIKIWRILHDEKKISNQASYIRKIVDSSVIDHLRRLKRDEGILAQERLRKISEKANPYSASLYREDCLKDIIGKAVDSLRESRRKVVKLFLLNLTIEEISLIFNWSKHKTRNLLYRGLADLKKILKDKDLEYEHRR